VDSLHVRKLYVRFFDIDWNPHSKAPEPVAPLIVQSSVPNSIEIIPTVFITNTTMVHIERHAVPILVGNILRKIYSITKDLKIRNIKEIQMDCDWTTKSKDNYFMLLRTLKTILDKDHIQLSVTLRLHQLAQPEQTGVPPADRGVLMFYNMGNIKEPVEGSAILDLSVGRQYIEASSPYPLPLDIALPVFQWCVVFRLGEVVSLINDFNEELLSDSTKYMKDTHNTYHVMKSHYACSHYLYKGDVLKLDRVTVKQLLESVDLLRKNNLPSPNSSIIYYHLEPTISKRYSHEDLHRIVTAFN
jgi:hypothetical protein